MKYVLTSSPAQLTHGSLAPEQAGPEQVASETELVILIKCMMYVSGDGELVRII